MFQKSHLKVVLMTAVVFGLGACNSRSSNESPSDDRASAENSTVYTSGTAVFNSKVAGPLVLRDANGEIVAKEKLPADFDKDIAELTAVTSVIETKEGFLELYAGSTMTHALNISNGSVRVAFQRDTFAPETIHYMVGESTEHHRESFLTFGLKSCASASVARRKIKVDSVCQYATVVMELIADSGQGQGQGSGSGQGQGSGSGQGSGQGQGSGSGTGSGQGSTQDKNQEKGQDKGQEKTPSKDQSTSQDKDAN